MMAVAAIGSAGLALADGYTPPRKVTYERPADWSGFYFGLHSGYQWTSTDNTLSGPGLAGPGPFSVDYDDWSVGGHIGIQHQFGTIVLGVEGNIDSLFRDKPGNTLCPGNATLNCNMRVDDIISVGGRIGYAAGHWMPYITGGYANAALHFTASDVTPLPYLTREESRTRNDGWYLGGGVEWIVSPGWIAGIEYRHYEFDNTSATTWTAQPTQGQPLERITTNASSDSITARMSWKFGREPAAAPPLK
jgi:outer membrane immunogenic protein